MRKSSLGGIQYSFCHLINHPITDIGRDIRGIYFAAGGGGEGQTFEFVVLFFWIGGGAYLAHCCAIFPCYLVEIQSKSTLDNQCRDSMNNDKDCQLLTRAYFAKLNTDG